MDSPCLVAVAFGERGAKTLGREIGRVLEVGYLRGVDVWHLACALYLVEGHVELSFITLDDRQATVAGGLGFET